MKDVKTFFSQLKEWRWLLMVIGAALLAFVLITGKESKEEISLSDLVNKTATGQIVKAELNTSNHKIEAKGKDGKVYTTNYPSDYGDDLIKQFQAKKVSYETQGKSWWWSLLGAMWFPLMLVALYYLYFRATNKQHTGILGNTDFSAERPTERFSDVQGADEAIEDLRSTVAALQDPAAYTGPPIDQGILLEGDTGTGKTLLARAMAGEAGVPFFHLSGAELTNVYVNSSAKLVGNFFDGVKKQLVNDKISAAIIFIDEIDGLVPRRQANSMSYGHQESATTVTQVLHHLEILFRAHPFVVVIGATNYKENIDSAVLRPGRLGKHIPMVKPSDPTARQKMILQKMEGLTVDETVDIAVLAEFTAGLSGAQIEAIITDARRLAFRRNQKVLSMEVLREAIIRTVMGVPRTSANVHPEDAAIAAAHESGHATVALECERFQLQYVTIIPIGQSGGSTWFVKDDRQLRTRDIIVQELAVMFGGLVAERQLNPNSGISIGAAHDLSEATQLATTVVCATSIGGITMTVDPEDWPSHPLAEDIRCAIQRLLDEAEAKAQEIITQHGDFVRSLKTSLLEQQSLDISEVLALREKMQP